MYNTHAMEISEHALKTPEGLVSVIRFTLCTIQQSLYSCENQISDIEKHGFKSRFLKNKMKGFNVSCLDSHNLNRLGLDTKDVSLPKGLTEKTKLKKIKAYVHLTQGKGTVYWWNSWCDYVAEKGGANKLLPTGEEVSAFHVGCVIR